LEQKHGNSSVVVSAQPAAEVLVPLESMELRQRASYSAKHLAKRDLLLTTVPLASFKIRTEVQSNRGYPRRIRMRPLETWRNERVCYERLKGSSTPSVAGVALNMAPRPTNNLPRKLDLSVLQVPPASASGGIEFTGLSTSTLKSRVFSLPGWRTGNQPCTVALPPTPGILFVLEGKIYAEGTSVGGKLELGKGDAAALPQSDEAVLVTPAGPRHPGALGARFLWVQVRNRALQGAGALLTPLAEGDVAAMPALPSSDLPAQSAAVTEMDTQDDFVD